MSGAGHDLNRIRLWHWLAPVAAFSLVAAKLAHFVSIDDGAVAALAVALLAGSVFAAVHHAEVLAARVGQPFGAILLALAITAMEAGLIISVMASGSVGSGSIARDAIYAVVMIVLNGIVGLCLVAGALRHFQQQFQLQGAVGILSVITTLAVLSLILPNYTLTTAGPSFAPSQLAFISIVSLVLYCLFVFVQTFRHRSDFIFDDVHESDTKRPGGRASLLSAILLPVSLISVILLAKSLSPIVEGAVLAAGMPHAVVGVIIAAVVLLPEGLTAIKAATQNRLQTSLNASLGSAAASIGLTIPIVGFASIYFGQELTLGIDEEETVLLVLTLFVSALTFATGRTTILQGAVHLVIFGVFLLLTTIP
jgi:Ca2+:H+ antiporter